MNILIVHWGAYTHSDFLQTFKKLHIHCQEVKYSFKDKNNDDFFINWFTTHLCESRFDAVFSVNYFPLIAQVCAKLRIKYLSWSYDCPLNVYQIEDTLGLDTNYVFLFDRIQVAHYQKQGFKNVWHLPLAVNPERLDQIRLTVTEQEYYKADISFVGNLYNSTFPTITAPLDAYTKGYLSAIVNSQLIIYGQNFLDTILTDQLMSSIVEQLNFSITKEQLNYSISTYITHNERLMLFKHLADNYNFKLYSSDESPLLSKAIHQGTVNYLTDMPKVFMSSKINFNVTVKNTQSGIPLRVMDILGSGGFLLSNYQPEIAEFFIPDTDFVYYDSIEDAFAKTDFYLNHNDLRQKIAINGCNKCRRNFNYTKQLSTLLQTAGINP